MNFKHLGTEFLIYDATTAAAEDDNNELSMLMCMMTDTLVSIVVPVAVALLAFGAVAVLVGLFIRSAA